MLNKKAKMAVLLAVGTIALSACNSVNSHPNRNGESDRLDWPNVSKTTFNKQRGTFPNVNNLNQIRSGMTKDELYDLIGRPHFNEGFRVREWDYLFHFNTPGVGTEGVTTCQYKVLFDSQRYARSFHWRAVDPVNAVCPPVVEKPAPAPAVIQAEPQVIIREVAPTRARIRQ